jgi:antitoxin component YwqK of YwqJK toxin-antitoxin module
VKQNIEHKNSKGQLHCENGPAVIKYYKNGNKEYEAYYLNHQHHRIDGPATIHYNENGNKKFEEYYLNNLKLKDWCKKYNILFERKYLIDNLVKIYKTVSIFK